MFLIKKIIEPFNICPIEVKIEIFSIIAIHFTLDFLLSFILKKYSFYQNQNYKNKGLMRNAILSSVHSILSPAMHLYVFLFTDYLKGNITFNHNPVSDYEFKYTIGYYIYDLILEIYYQGENLIYIIQHHVYGCYGLFCIVVYHEASFYLRYEIIYIL
jgi:hypothetical protein